MALQITSDMSIEAILEQVQNRIDDLTLEIEELEAVDDANRTVANAKAEIKSLEIKRNTLRRSISNYTDQIGIEKTNLEQLETLAKSVAAQPLRTKQIASELYAERVSQLQKQLCVDARQANALATEDDMAKRLYALITEASEAAAYNQGVMLDTK